MTRAEFFQRFAKLEKDRAKRQIRRKINGKDVIDMFGIVGGFYASCLVCGKQTGFVSDERPYGLHRAHIIPRKVTGRNADREHIFNLAPLCCDCHNNRVDRPVLYEKAQSFLSCHDMQRKAECFAKNGEYGKAALLTKLSLLVGVYDQDLDDYEAFRFFATGLARASHFFRAIGEFYESKLCLWLLADVIKRPTLDNGAFVSAHNSLIAHELEQDNLKSAIKWLGNFRTRRLKEDSDIHAWTGIVWKKAYIDGRTQDLRKGRDLLRARLKELEFGEIYANYSAMASYLFLLDHQPKNALDILLPAVDALSSFDPELFNSPSKDHTKTMSNAAFGYWATPALLRTCAIVCQQNDSEAAAIFEESYSRLDLGLRRSYWNFNNTLALRKLIRQFSRRISQRQ